MKKVYLFLSLISVFAFITVSCDRTDDISESIQNKSDNAKEKCTTIQSGELIDGNGDAITLGYTDYGYNYQAHMYNGDYYGDGSSLIMKWNDAWLSNQDCDSDGKLDRHYGFTTYIGSGAWLTNHYTENYVFEGNECMYSEFIKIVAVPEDAYIDNGNWYTADDVLIGEVIWGQFAIIQYIVNDPCGGYGGSMKYKGSNPGLGIW